MTGIDPLQDFDNMTARRATPAYQEELKLQRDLNRAIATAALANYDAGAGMDGLQIRLDALTKGRLGRKATADLAQSTWMNFGRRFKDADKAGKERTAQRHPQSTMDHGDGFEEDAAAAWAET